MYQQILSRLATSLQKPLLEPRRLFHGRGHMFEGLEHVNIDFFPPVLLITGYKPIVELQALIDAIKALDVSNQIKSVVCQRRSSKGAPAEWMWGEKYEVLTVEENGLKFEVQPGQHQNAGLFLDMRPLRTWLKKYSEGKNVLNLFSYTCSLSVAALAGGARQVVSVDMSKPSINWGKRNHELNNHNPNAVRSLPLNVFKAWKKIEKGAPYDLVIIDPPTRQRGSFDAEKDYVQVLKKLDRLTSKNSEVIATLNSPYLGLDHLPNLMQRYQSKFRLLGEFSASEEFEDKYPDRALKIFHFKH